MLPRFIDGTKLINKWTVQTLNNFDCSHLVLQDSSGTTKTVAYPVYITPWRRRFARCQGGANCRWVKKANITILSFFFAIWNSLKGETQKRDQSYQKLLFFDACVFLFLNLTKTFFAAIVAVASTDPEKMELFRKLKVKTNLDKSS